MGVTMNIPLSGVLHGAGMHDDTARAISTWDGFTFGVEFVATSPGVAVVKGNAASPGYVRVVVDKDDAGSDIKYWTESSNWGDAAVSVPFNKGDGVTLVYSVLSSPDGRVYYFA